jgi:uncharacterized protein (DUF2267 family)
MSATRLAAFDSTIQTTHIWLKDICEEMRWGDDQHRAYQALRSVLHALRDRLHPEEAAGFAAQLPLLIRGIFYEGWHPHGKPVKTHTRSEFLAPVATAFSDSREDPAAIARAVFRVIERHLTSGEVDDVKAALPTEIRSLWD